MGTMDDGPYFTPETERSLIRDAQKGDLAARDRLLLKALPFVCKRLRRRYPNVDPQDFDDLVQESVAPLLECIQRYDLDHPARARFYVFAAAYIDKAVLALLRHHSLLSYREQLPDLPSSDDPLVDVESDQLIALTRRALSRLCERDVDVLYSRHAVERAVPRRELADRYSCSQHVIHYAEKRAIERFLMALPARTSNPISIN